MNTHCRHIVFFNIVLVALACARNCYAAADLVADISALPEIVITNTGDTVSRPHFVTLQCLNLEGGGCARSPAMAPYVHPTFPGLHVMRIPELRPGQSHMHVLSFWQELRWQPGIYRMRVKSDAGDHVTELDEKNNLASVVVSH